MCDRIYTSLVHHFGTKRYKYIGNTTEYLSSRKQRVMHGGLYGEETHRTQVYIISYLLRVHIYLLSVRSLRITNTNTISREQTERG